MINGAHIVLFSTDPDADRAVMGDVFGMPHVDVGDGWLIFGLPPAEVAVHPPEGDRTQALYLMCSDIEAFTRRMGTAGLSCTGIEDAGWGRLVYLTLPGGGRLGVYEPRHARPPSMP